MKRIEYLILVISLCFTIIYYDYMIHDLDSRPDNLTIMNYSDEDVPVNEEGTRVRIPDSLKEKDDIYKYHHVHDGYKYREYIHIKPKYEKDWDYGNDKE